MPFETQYDAPSPDTVLIDARQWNLTAIHVVNLARGAGFSITPNEANAASGTDQDASELRVLLDLAQRALDFLANRRPEMRYRLIRSIREDMFYLTVESQQSAPFGFMVSPDERHTDECEECGTCICDDCGPCESCMVSSSGATIYGYGFKPRWRPRGRDSRTFLGAEVELACEGYGPLDDCAEIANNALMHGEYGFLKEDGSIEPTGFELVTQPMTWQWANRRFPWDTFADLSESGMYEDRSCGIHVHVSRDGFDGPTHIYKWLATLYRNPMQWKWIAGRDRSHYANWDTGVRESAKTVVKNRGERHERYSAVNTNNDDTFECRFFATTLDPTMARARVGLVSSLVEYTRQLDTHAAINGGMRYAAFAEWLGDHTADYTALCDVIAEMPQRRRNARERVRIGNPLMPGDFVRRRRDPIADTQWCVGCNSWH